MKKEKRAAHVKAAEPKKRRRVREEAPIESEVFEQELPLEEQAPKRGGRPAPKPKKPRKSAALPLIIISVVLITIVSALLYAGYSITQSPKILPNVQVGEIELGGLDSAQAHELLNAQWKARAETPLTVTGIGGVQCSVDPVRSGLTLGVGEAVKAACAHGHDGNIVENLIAYIKNIFVPVDVNVLHAEADKDYINSCMDELVAGVDAFMGEDEYVIDFDSATLTLKKGWKQLGFDKAAMGAAIEAALIVGETELQYTVLSSPLSCPDFEAIHEQYDLEPRDASYSEDGKFDVIDEVIGCRFDIAGAEKLWNEAKPGDTVTIPLDLTLPAVTGEELRGRLFHDLLGACTTKYPNSGEARRSNLRLAVSMLNEYILYPGETISFNDTVGERTEEAGFLPAPAYVDGDVKDEIGGGVCQVSSTLYASTVFAFLETVERECHFFPVNYMQMGTDATVTIPDGGRSVDFKFKNNKNYPIKIVGYCDNENSTITFEIWGTLEENDYMPIKFDNSYTWQFDYMRDVEPSYEGRPGYTIKLTHETYSFEDDIGPGYRTLTYRIVLDENGNQVAKELINPKLGNGNYAMDTYYQH